MRARAFCCSLALGAGALGCGAEEAGAARDDGLFHWVARTDAALMSVHGTNADDAWLAGADDGTGPLVLHWDGAGWQRLETAVTGDLWWVHATLEGPVFLCGSQGLALRYQDGSFESLPAPAGPEHTLFGVWAAAQDDVYFAGAVAGKSGFLWHYDGVAFEPVALPELPEDADGNAPGLFKVWGTSAEDVWTVGGGGTVLRGNARDGFRLVRAGGSATLFTVHSNGDLVAIVGGASSGVIFESSGGELVDVTPPSAPLLQGVSVASDGTVWAAGYAGTLYEDPGGGFAPVDTGLDFRAAESLHAVWVDPSGGVWAAGGDVLTPALAGGLALHRGAKVSEYTGAAR
jgi:hypothetical protein